MRSALLVASLGAALAAAAPARAQDYARPGPYVALNALASVPLSDLSRDETGIGASGRVGYRATEHVAVEGQFEYSGDHGFGDTHLSLLTANAKLYLGLARVQPYAVLGLGAAFPSSGERNDDASFGVRAGAGVDLYFTERVGALLEAAYVRPTGDSGDALDAVSIGWGVFYRW